MDTVLTVSIQSVLQLLGNMLLQYMAYSFLVGLSSYYIQKLHFHAMGHLLNGHMEVKHRLVARI